MQGAGLSRSRSGKAPLGKPAFQPSWGKPAVRNDRGDRGNVGIIRSPIRASILPDRRPRMVPPRTILAYFDFGLNDISSRALALCRVPDGGHDGPGNPFQADR